MSVHFKESYVAHLHEGQSNSNQHALKQTMTTIKSWVRMHPLQLPILYLSMGADDMVNYMLEVSQLGEAWAQAAWQTTAYAAIGSQLLWTSGPKHACSWNDQKYS